MTTLSDFAQQTLTPPPPNSPVPCREIVCENKRCPVAWDYARNARKQQPDAPVEVLPENSDNSLFRVEQVVPKTTDNDQPK